MIMSYSSGSLFFTGIVVILIIFQIVVLINFQIGFAKLDAIIENQEVIIELLEDIYDQES